MQLKVSRKRQLYFPYLAAAQRHIQGAGGLADHINLLGGTVQCGGIAAGFQGRNGSVIRNRDLFGAVFAAGGNVQEHAVQGAGAAGNFFQENAVGDGGVAVHRNRAVHSHPVGVQLGAGKIIVRLSGRLQSQGVVFKLPALAGIICPVAIPILCHGRVTAFLNHQPGQRTYSYFGHTVCRRCGEGDFINSADILELNLEITPTPVGKKRRRCIINGYIKGWKIVHSIIKTIAYINRNGCLIRDDIA